MAVALVLLTAAGCAMPKGLRQDYMNFMTSVTQELQTRNALLDEAKARETPPNGDFEQELTLDQAVEVALQNNPAILEALKRVEASAARVVIAASFEDPELRIAANEVPIRRALDFNKADSISFGLMQRLPFFGKRKLRGETALAEAKRELEMYKQLERDLIAEVKAAYHERFLTQRELDILVEHVNLLSRFVAIAEIKYATGRVTQQDVIKGQVERTNVQKDAISVEQQGQSVSAMLNRLMNRPVRAALAMPKEFPPAQFAYSDDELEALALERRPELKAAAQAVERSEKAKALAERDAKYPDFGLGWDFMQMPMKPEAWAGFFSFNLPWVNPRRKAEVQERTKELAADQAAYLAVRNRVMFEVRDAALKTRAAERKVALIQHDLLPRAEQNMEAARVGYEKERVDFLTLIEAQRAWLEARLDYYKALVEFEVSYAQLEKAVGTGLPRDKGSLQRSDTGTRRQEDKETAGESGRRADRSPHLSPKTERTVQ